MSSKVSPSIIKAAAIIEYVAKHEQCLVSDIYKHFSLAKSSTLAIVNSLVECEFLVKDASSTYSLGYKLKQIVNLNDRQSQLRHVAEKAMISLRDKTKLTSHLGVIDNGMAVYLKKVNGLLHVIPNSWEGKKLSLHSSALGKVLLAWESSASNLIKHIDFY